MTVGEVAEIVRRAAPFSGLPDSALDAVLDMLAGAIRPMRSPNFVRGSSGTG